MTFYDIVSGRATTGSVSRFFHSASEREQTQGSRMLYSGSPAYSYRRATIGSTRMARRAGMYPASAATAARESATPASVAGSLGDTLKSIWPTRCEAASAHG